MIVSHLRQFFFGTIRGRLILSVAAVHAVMMSLFIMDLTARHRAMLLSQQMEEAKVLAQSLSTSAPGWIAAADISGLQEIIDAQRGYPELLFAMLTDKQGLVLAHTDLSRRGTYLLDLPHKIEPTLISQTPALCDMAVPAFLGGRHVGWVRVGIGQKAASAKLAGIIRDGVLYAFAAILIGSIIAWFMARRMTRRLYAIQETIHEVHSGNCQARSSLAGNDEASVMAHEFNGMLDALARRDAELLESEKKFGTLFESANDAVFICEIKENGMLGCFTNVNAQSCKLLGYTKTELMQLSPMDIDTSCHRDKIPEVAEQILKNSRAIFETDLVAKDGRSISVEVSARALASEGTRLVFSLVRDITERKLAQQKIQQLADIVASSHDAIIGKTLNGIITSWNKGAELMYGYTGSEMIGQTIALLVPPGHSDEVPEILGRIASGEHIAHYETVRQRKDGQLIQAVLSISPIFNPAGRIVGASTIGHDITQRKQIEEAVRKSEEFYRELFDKLPMGYQSLDAEGHFRVVNQIWLDTFGYTREEVIGKWFGDFIGPESAELFRKNFPRFKATGKTSVEFEMVCKDGSQKTVTFEGRIGHDLDGNFKQTHCVLQDVTELRRIEKAKREAEERYRQLVEGTDDLITAVDAQGRFTFVNHSCRNILGIDPEDCLGRLFIDFIHPEDRKKTAEAFESWIREKRRHVVHQNRQVHKDGRVFEVFWNVNIRFNDSGEVTEMINFARDITELKRAEAAVAASEQQFRTILENADEVIYALTWEGVFNFVSAAWTRIVGHPVSEIIGRSFVPFVHPEDVEACMRFLKLTHESGQPQRGVEYRVKTTKGGWVWFTSTGAVIRDAQGNPDYYVGVAADITERKKAMADLQRMNEELEERVQQRTAELSVAIKELEAFSYSVSHDLKAPLRAMTGFANILAEDYAPKLDENGRRVIKVITDNARTMGQLIDELLKLSRLGRKTMEAVDIDMTALAQSVYDELKEELSRDRAIEFLLKPLPPVKADATMARQIFTNLISNAMKFTARKEKAVIEVGSYDQDGERVYYVRDNGVGFEMKYLDKLFEVFQRLHPQNEFEGTGVGLAIVSRSAMRHGGRVWAEGAVDQGATFYFTLSGRKNTSERVF